MAGNSFYLQLSPYLLLEYEYGDSTTATYGNKVKFGKITNGYNKGQVQLVNDLASYNTTQNTLNTSAVNIGGYKWAYLNTNAPVPYINLDSKIGYNDLSSFLSSLYTIYDTVKIHIMSGYNLSDLQGLIIQVSANQAGAQIPSILANNVFLISDTRDILNPDPILLGDALYDKYIQFSIPSLQDIINTSAGNSTNQYSLNYQYTSDNRGFLFNSNIYVTVYEIQTVNIVNGSTFFNTSNSYNVNINQADTYSSLVANIQEASDGNYFLYYPTYEGEFIQNFIDNLNAGGGNYVVINDINVYEQMGVDSIMTSSFSQIQTSGFDGPLFFRPILSYAGSDVSFSIDYSLRVYNKLNGFQIIRRASTTSFNCYPYGKNLKSIALDQQAYPFKVYNMVSGNPVVSINSNSYNTTFNTVYVPVFYEIRNIIIQNKSVLPSGINSISPNFYSNIYFGQGDARLYLSNFSSYFKFIVYQIDPNSGAIVTMDLSGGEISLNFEDTAGNLLTYPAITGDQNTLATKGQISFNVPGNVKNKVLTTSSIEPFYITIGASGAASTLLYTAYADTIANISGETARLNTLISNSSTLSGLVNTGTSGSSTTVTTTSTSASNVAAALGVSNTTSLMQALTNANSASIASINGNNTPVNPVVVPNYNVSTGAASIKNSIVPASLSTGASGSSTISTNLSQSTGTTTSLNNN